MVVGMVEVTVEVEIQKQMKHLFVGYSFLNHIVGYV